MYKKIFAFICAAALVLSVFSGCSTDTDGNETEKITEEETPMLSASEIINSIDDGLRFTSTFGCTEVVLQHTNKKT
ncbi:MAG: hypothetical protein E7623_01635 [Ruminococcaceae bacterium]|nr:hypothetical protein [Oscillospiraceae bacterium]